MLEGYGWLGNASRREQYDCLFVCRPVFNNMGEVCVHLSPRKLDAKETVSVFSAMSHRIKNNNTAIMTSSLNAFDRIVMVAAQPAKSTDYCKMSSSLNCLASD
jgi:hypothetical protein